MADIDLAHILLLYVVLLVSLTVHEASHAWLAMLGGDRTAYVGGQVTLNPIPHVKREPFGTVILPLIVLFSSGGTWILGYAHTPIDARWAERHPKRAALMSAAGPVSNFLIAAIALLGLKALVWGGIADPWGGGDRLTFVSVIEDSAVWSAVAEMLSAFLLLNVLLGIFNLFPWPPLDGAGVAEGLFPRQLRSFYETVRSQLILLLIGIVVIWQILPEVFWPAMGVVVRWI